MRATIHYIWATAFIMGCVSGCTTGRVMRLGDSEKIQVTRTAPFQVDGAYLFINGSSVSVSGVIADSAQGASARSSTQGHVDITVAAQGAEKKYLAPIRLRRIPGPRLTRRKKYERVFRADIGSQIADIDLITLKWHNGRTHSEEM